jgi:orotate phosphoribosyltransferase
MNLFQNGNFNLASGGTSKWKIECDALTKDDWKTLAMMAVDLLPNFSHVVGVPNGGIPFADALWPYRTANADRLLLAEDVVTTGGSITKIRDQVRLHESIIGVCVFARGICPRWIMPLFQMPTTGVGVLLADKRG